MLEPLDVETGRGGLDDERAHAPAGLLGVGVRHGEDDQQVGDAGMADEALGTVEGVPAAVAGANCAGLRRGRIGTGCQFRERERDQLPAGGEVGQPRPLLVIGAREDDRQRRELLDGEDEAARRIDAAQLLDRDAGGQQVGTDAAVFLRKRQAEDVLPRKEVLDVVGEFRLLVDLGGARPDLLVGQRPDRVAEEDLVLGQPERLGSLGHEPDASSAGIWAPSPLWCCRAMCEPRCHGSHGPCG